MGSRKQAFCFMKVAVISWLECGKLFYLARMENTDQERTVLN